MYQRIRSLREEKNITQAQIAEILNCSQKNYSYYENGKLDIPTDILIKLADFHNVSTDYILEISDKKQTHSTYTLQTVEKVKILLI